MPVWPVLEKGLRLDLLVRSLQELLMALARLQRGLKPPVAPRDWLRRGNVAARDANCWSDRWRRWWGGSGMAEGRASAPGGQSRLKKSG